MGGGGGGKLRSGRRVESHSRQQPTDPETEIFRFALGGGEKQKGLDRRRISVYLYFFPTVAAYSLLHTGIPKESEEEFNRT